jgi:hypothetical protein
MSTLIPERTLANYLKRRDREISKLAVVTPMCVRLRTKKAIKIPDPYQVHDNDKSLQCNFEEVPRHSQPFEYSGWSHEDDRYSLAILKPKQFDPEIPHIRTVAPKHSSTIIRKLSQAKARDLKRCERCRCSRTACRECRRRPLSASAEGSLAQIKPESRRKGLEFSKLELKYLKGQINHFDEDRGSNPVIKPQMNTISQSNPTTSYKPPYPTEGDRAGVWTGARLLSPRHKSALFRVEVKYLPKTQRRNLSVVKQWEPGADQELKLEPAKSAKLPTVPIIFDEYCC